jgi:hypothetical protein
LQSFGQCPPFDVTNDVAAGHFLDAPWWREAAGVRFSYPIVILSLRRHGLGFSGRPMPALGGRLQAALLSLLR